VSGTCGGTFGVGVGGMLPRISRTMMTVSENKQVNPLRLPR